MPANTSAAVRGVGLRLPGVAGLDDLARQLTGRGAPSCVRRFEAPDTDLEPVERRVHGPVEPRMPGSVATRGLRSLPYESVLALAAAAEAVSPYDTGSPAAVVWASSTAGLTEYATVGVQASTLDPGLASPVLGPASAFNAPAATVSIRLGLTGPNLTLTGGPTAGMCAVVEAMRLIADGDASAAVVGASATVSRWSLPAAPADLVPAEGAACLALTSRPDGDAAIRLSGCRRIHATGSSLAEFIPVTGRADELVVSAPSPELALSVSAGLPFPVWHLEQAVGDFGAAGGFMAAICAVALCSAAGRPTTVLALAVEPTANASLMEVSSL